MVQRNKKVVWCCCYKILTLCMCQLCHVHMTTVDLALSPDSRLRRIHRCQDGFKVQSSAASSWKVTILNKQKQKGFLGGEAGCGCLVSGGSCAGPIELETTIIRRFPKIS